VPTRTGNAPLWIVVGIVVAIVGVAVYGLSTVKLNFILTPSRRHLKPIPIAASACP